MFTSFLNYIEEKSFTYEDDFERLFDNVLPSEHPITKLTAFSKPDAKGLKFQGEKTGNILKDKKKAFFIICSKFQENHSENFVQRNNHVDR